MPNHSLWCKDLILFAPIILLCAENLNMFTFEVARLDDDYEDELYDDVQEMCNQIQCLSAHVFATEKGKGWQFNGVEPPQ